MRVPCYGCKERNITCHGHCQKYLAFAAECEQRRKTEADRIPWDYIMRHRQLHDKWLRKGRK